MDERLSLRRLAQEWADYLGQHGHRVKWSSGDRGAYSSRNGRGIRYRWLLRCIEGESILLTGSERRALRREIRLADNAGYRCYLVIRFGQLEGKVIVVPAVEALKTRRLSAEKGGIPWHW